MTARPPHVRVEMRKVYVSARGAKLTKHAAYIAAAKHLIAARCAKWNHEALMGNTTIDHDGSEIVLSGYRPCDKHGKYQCRFHAQHFKREDLTGAGHYDDVPQGMVHYMRVMKRLVRFLKYVDKRGTR